MQLFNRVNRAGEDCNHEEHPVKSKKSLFYGAGEDNLVEVVNFEKGQVIEVIL